MSLSIALIVNNYLSILSLFVVKNEKNAMVFFWFRPGLPAEQVLQLWDRILGWLGDEDP